MASASLDHMISLIIFIAAILIFIAFFTQNIQTATSYQQHTAMSTKTSDLLDTLLLTPGLPVNWAQNDVTPQGFGLQDPRYSQYKLSSFAPMRLSTATAPVYYTLKDAYYNNLTAGWGSYLLTPINDGAIQSLTYQRASEMLGVNGTYGFHFSLTPTVTVSVEKTSTSGSLQFSVDAVGNGFVLAEANVTYSLIVVNQDANEYPVYDISSGNSLTNAAGNLQLSFPSVDGETRSYALLVYTHIYGLKGAGYYVHMPDSAKTVVPLIDSFQNRAIRLAHSDTVGDTPAYTSAQLRYRASFAVFTEEYTLREVLLDQTDATGIVNATSSGSQILTLPISDPGILLIAYKDISSSQYGIALVPWGLGSLAFPVDFGGNPAGHDWVTTDLRQVTVGGIAYQAKLDLWILQGGS